MIMHYGILLDTDKPTTGVRQNSKLTSSFSDAVGDGIDLAYEEHLAECRTKCQNCDCNHDDIAGDVARLCSCPGEWSPCDGYDPTGDHEDCAPQERGTVLIGSWKKNAEGLYEPDETGDYAAIVGESVTQIAWSRTVERGALCSPCFPGQVDQDTPGQYLGYDLPKHMIEEG